MKANAPKRKIFNDAVDMLTDTSVAGANDVQMLPVDSIKTFRNHPFHLYEEMMDEIHSGKVNCVVVKDLSRFGRNYIEAGNYIERAFPFMGVRFIAINDSYDSTDRSQADSLIVPFKNLIKNISCLGRVFC